MDGREWAKTVIEQARSELGTRPTNAYEPAENGFMYEGNNAIVTLLGAILLQLVDLENGLAVVCQRLDALDSGN